MKYSTEFKLKCVEMYREEKYPETPEGISKEDFHKTIRQWVRMEEAAGPEALKHKNHNKEWSAEERYELVAKVLAGQSNKSVAISAGINPGLLYQWVRRYKMRGYEGLATMKKGKPPKESSMKKKELPAELTPSEREEMIRLKAENEYLRAENAVIKKEIALREEKWAAQLKAKKQRSSRNSEKKDMETFFGRLKNEMFYGFEKQYDSFATFSAAVAAYSDYYNNYRIQRKTNWMPPAKYREASMMINYFAY